MKHISLHQEVEPVSYTHLDVYKRQDQISGKQEVLAPILDGIDRFYIMALEDVDKHWCHHWYANVSDMKDFAITTAMDFGLGQKNTLNIIEKWNKENYGAQDSDDMWSLIQEQVNDGWFIPSIDEWCAFTEQLGITESNHSSKEMCIRDRHGTALLL